MPEGPHYRPEDAKKIDATKTTEDDKQKAAKIEIQPYGLEVTWGGDNRYWDIPDGKPSKITLLQVSWLEVIGNMPTKELKLAAKARYKVQFKMSLKPDAFGWNGCPVYLTVKNHEGKYVWKNADLSQLSKNPEDPSLVPKEPTTLTFETPAEGVTMPDRFFFGLYEIWRGRWKGGLQIHGVVITRVA